MKKFIFILFAIMLALLFVGCSSGKEQKITLTTTNIEDYISFSVTISDCQTTSEKLTCNANVKTFSVRECTFENVKIKITINDTSMIWVPNSTSAHTLTLNFNGESQTTQSFYATNPYANYLSSSNIDIKIKSVSGYAII